MPCQRKKRLLTDAFGRILRGHRERLGVTLNQLARQIDIDQGLLSKIERGKRPPPQIVPYVQRIAVVLGFAEGSTEFTELMQAAYSGRFGQKWPGGIVSVSLEGGETVATHIPFIPRALGEYAPPERREIVHPDSPLGRNLGLRPEDVAADRAQPRQDTATCPFGLAPLQPVLARLPEMFGATMTKFNLQDESFNLEFRLPDGRNWEMSIRPKNRPSEDAS